MSLDLRDDEVEVPVGPQGPSRGLFVYAPVEWIVASNRCREHCASKVAILCWFLHSVNKRETFKVSNTDAAIFALDRKQKAAGLRALERAGLISIMTRSGRSPLVTLTWKPGRRFAN